LASLAMSERVVFCHPFLDTSLVATCTISSFLIFLMSSLATKNAPKNDKMKYNFKSHEEIPRQNAMKNLAAK